MASRSYISMVAVPAAVVWALLSHYPVTADGNIVPRVYLPFLIDLRVAPLFTPILPPVRPTAPPEPTPPMRVSGNCTVTMLTDYGLNGVVNQREVDEYVDGRIVSHASFEGASTTPVRGEYYVYSGPNYKLAFRKIDLDGDGETELSWEYGYDLEGRLNTERQREEESGEVLKSYSYYYDSNSNMIRRESRVRGDPVVVFRSDYDNQGRIMLQERQRTVSIYYWNNDKLVRIYDVYVRDARVELEIAMSYDQSGNLASMTTFDHNGGGMVGETRWEYNQYNWVTHQEYSRGGHLDSSIWMDYDDQGRLILWRDSIDLIRVDISYDCAQ